MILMESFKRSMELSSTGLSGIYLMLWTPSKWTRFLIEYDKVLNLCHVGVGTLAFLVNERPGSWIRVVMNSSLWD